MIQPTATRPQLEAVTKKHVSEDFRGVRYGLSCVRGSASELQIQKPRIKRAALFGGRCWRDSRVAGNPDTLRVRVRVCPSLPCWRTLLLCLSPPLSPSLSLSLSPFRARSPSPSLSVSLSLCLCLSHPGDTGLGVAGSQAAQRCSGRSHKAARGLPDPSPPPHGQGHGYRQALQLRLVPGSRLDTHGLCRYLVKSRKFPLPCRSCHGASQVGRKGSSEIDFVPDTMVLFN